VHEKLDLIAASGALKGRATVVDLKDNQRGLVWVNGRFTAVLPPGLYVYWDGPRDVRVEVADARRPRFEHEDLRHIARSPALAALMDVCTVGRNTAGVLFLDGRYAETLAPGVYAFWKGVVDVHVVEVDLRETALDVGGQEIMTADKVTLRLNALVTCRVTDPRRAVCAADDARQALYREAQLALRAVVGVRELDALLADKDVVAREVEELLGPRAGELGLEVLSAGVRDMIRVCQRGSRPAAGCSPRACAT
jgi:regulator of protease activity HflC (stomatin/prohibitin superfamily)